LGETPDETNFIIITHAHFDHFKSLLSFARVYNTKVYIGKEIFNEYIKNDYLRNYKFVESIDNILGINVTKIPISHDKKGFVYEFEKDNKSVVVQTDTGMIHSKYHSSLINKTVYLLESNHDVEMEMKGTKDEMTKIRNIGDEGHLSNEQYAMYLNHFIGQDTKSIIFMHISEHYNTYDLVENTNRNTINPDIPIFMSYKDNMSEVIEI
jgi:phosphoribosyl 1,2-cyclic phosphodiesterase